MASMPATAPTVERTPISARKDEERPRAPELKSSRDERFEEAHAWVLEHHARTFEKLAK